VAIGFAKNYFVYRTAIATPYRPPRSVAQHVTEAVFDALGLNRHTNRPL
jgi:hypothetical protein